MTATNWAGTANLQGTVSGTGVVRKIDRQPKAKLSASGSAASVGYTAAQLATLVAVFDAETDADTRHATLARLVAYCAAAEADSVQDRSTAVHALERIRKDANLLLNHLYNFYGPAGLIVDRPSAELLFELESLVASKRVSAGLPPLPGTSY